MFDQFEGRPTRSNGMLWEPGDGVDDLNIDSYLEQHEDERMLEEERRNFEEWEEEQFLLEEQQIRSKTR